MSPECADAKRLLALNHGHWTIENLNHRIQDPTFAEDACLIHTRHGPPNNTALAVIFHRGRNDVAATVQEFAMDRGRQRVIGQDVYLRDHCLTSATSEKAGSVAQLSIGRSSKGLQRLPSGGCRRLSSPLNKG